MVYGKDVVNDMIAWEEGTLSEEKTTKLFQKLVNTGEVWQLQGTYGRQAQALIDAGFIKLPSKKSLKHKTDFYGQKLRTRD